MTDYESPAKQKLRDALARVGTFASPALRKSIEDTVEKIDDTDPATVRDRLPPNVLGFYRECAVRARQIVVHAGRARDAGFHIETIIVCHNLIQYALRGLYVLAWQRSREDSLTEEELRPFYDPADQKATVANLVPLLDDPGLLNEPQGALLLEVNKIRNQVAHGIVFGEVSPDELESLSEKTQWAALGALERMHGWFTNPQPLKRTFRARGPIER